MKPQKRKSALVSLLFAVVLVAMLVMPVAAVTEQTGWRGEYFNNATLSGFPALVRDDAILDFSWEANESPAAGIPADYFSVRWTRDVQFEAGTVRFHTLTDDGVRLYVDGILVIDEWRVMAPTEHTAEVQLTAGFHNVRMEFFEARGGAVAKLWWSSADSPTSGWRGEYFNNRWLSGSPILVRDDESISANWGFGSPAAVVPGDQFSVRWTRDLVFEAGFYRFTTGTDDGVRLFIDGSLVIDQWHLMASTAFTEQVYLSGGSHSIRMEYFENTGLASAGLIWEGPIAFASEGNLVSCVHPQNSWLKVYQLTPSGHWMDVRPHGYGPLDSTGFLKIDSLSVDYARYGDAGHPYRIELWVAGSLHASVGDTGRGEAEFRIRPDADNYTSWPCPGIPQMPALPKLKVTAELPNSGNLVTWVRPQNSWVKAYQLQPNGSWLDINPQGWAASDESGFVKVDGLPVDYFRYKSRGHPYRIELWAGGQVIRSVGNTSQGESEFRIRLEVDNYTPWGQNP